MTEKQWIIGMPLGLRQIPSELNEFKLNTFFTFSAKERALIDARHKDLHRLALAMHIGYRA